MKGSGSPLKSTLGLGFPRLEIEANQIKEVGPFNLLPTELISSIFLLLSPWKKMWAAPSLVSKQWQQLFVSVSPFLNFQNPSMRMSELPHLLSCHADIIEWDECINNGLNKWMIHQMKNPDLHVTAIKLDYIKANLCLFNFDLLEKYNPAIEDYILPIKNPNLIAPDGYWLKPKTFDPRLDVTNLLDFFNHEHCKDFLKEALKFGYIRKDIIFYYNNFMYLNIVAIEYNTENYKIIPDKFLTSEMHLAFVSAGGRLQDVLEAHRTYEVCLAAVQNWGVNLNEVPYSLRTDELLLAAYESYPRNFEFLPKNLKTPERSLEAVKWIPNNLKFVEEKNRTWEMCIEALLEKEMFEYIPVEFHTCEFFLELVNIDGCKLVAIPDRFKTYEICLAAMKKNSDALHFIPEKFRRGEIAILIAEKGPVFFKNYIPKEFKTYEVCLAAVKKNGFALEFVPLEFKTIDLCMAAVNNQGSSLEDVPPDLINFEMCLAAVKNDGISLGFVPSHLITYEICLEAVKKCVFSLEYVPVHLKTEELCFEAVKFHGGALKFVPKDCITPHMYEEAIKSWDRAFNSQFLVGYCSRNRILHPSHYLL